MNMTWKPKLLSSLIALALFDIDAAVMREDVSVQDYRDFAENLGKYSPGKEGVEVLKKDGTPAGKLNFPIPDFSAIDSNGIATLTHSSYIASVAHNGGYQSVNFGNKAKYNTEYQIINRNDDPAYKTNNKDFHLPRLNKVVTETAPMPIADPNDVKNDSERYQYFARAGTGTQYQIDPVTKEKKWLSGAYSWKTGGTITNPTFQNGHLTWKNYGPNDPRVEPFSSGIQPGDSGSPLYVYDNKEKIWKLIGVSPWVGGNGPYNLESYTLYMQQSFMNSVLAKNTDPDVTDSTGMGDIHWTKASISQGNNSWQWHGVDAILPYLASNAQLDASKDLRFAGDGGRIVLEDSINHGAAKLRFSNNYQVDSAPGKNSTWVGGGIEIDAEKTVDWRVNGLLGDNLHKIGKGTLHVNGIGNNEGGLNVGDGLVILNQRVNARGQQQAFSSVTLVSGRPTVRIEGQNQIESNRINFGYRGGTLDVNGHDFAFKTINHNDNGAKILNSHPNKLSTLRFNNSNNQRFIGHLGSEETRFNLDIDYSPESALHSWELAGGAELNKLSVNRGTFILSGRPTPHAGGVVVDNDWIDETYSFNNIDVASFSTLRVSEHASLTAKVKLNERARMVLNSKSHLKGEVDLTSGSLISVDQKVESTTSTDGGNDVVIDAEIRGDGKLVKGGPGTLYFNSFSPFTGSTDINGGSLVLNGSLHSTLTMGDNTQLYGSGTLFSDLIFKNNVRWAPSRTATSDGYNFNPAVQRINGNLTTGNNTLLSLRTHLDRQSAQTDKLLIKGDVITKEPISVRISLSGNGLLTDFHNLGHADNDEGLSLIQVAGQASKNSFKLAQGYVARGAYAYGLYAFAPGKSSAKQREVEGFGNQYWDYRLQNTLLSEGENAIPQNEAYWDERPAPEPSNGLIEELALKSGNDGSRLAKQNSSKASRKAVTPQIPSYLSLSSAILNYSSRLNETFRNQVLATQDTKLNIFFQYLNGEDKYHSSLGFMNYGYDYTQKQSGWLLGGKALHLANDTHSLDINLGLSNTQLDVTPQAADGNSKIQYTAWGISSLASYEHNSGITVDLSADIAKYDGNVSTDLRGGDVADIHAKSIGATLDVGRKFKLGNHQLTPLVGVGIQHLQIDDVTDVDNTKVDYNDINRPTIRTGLRYRYNWDTSKTGKWALIANTTFIKDLSSDATLDIGSTFNSRTNSFISGSTGSSGMIDVGIINNPVANISLNAGVQYQRRLDNEGVNYWQGVAGVKISF